jgi:glycerol uptake facilitator-like aquaporin
MKALIAVGIFVMLAGVGLLYLSHTGINLHSDTQVRTFKKVKSHAKSKIHTDFSPVPGWVALGGGALCAGIGIAGLMKHKD